MIIVTNHKGFTAIMVIALVAALAIGFFFFIKKDQNLPLSISQGKQEEIFYEKIPGSKFHGPDATWWGYNQSKIVRFGDTVFMYAIDNVDDSNKTLSNFVIYKKQTNNPWEKGASFPTSRPGNLLIDSKGVLHAFVFEPTDVTKNDSWGKLKHYSFPKSKEGNITHYEQETVIDNNGTQETVNIRTGAAIGKDDTMALAFGLPFGIPPYQGQSEHLYFKKPSELTWNHLIVGQNLGHDYYYPFVTVNTNGFSLLPVQDDWADDNNPATYDNIYQKIAYFEYENGKWIQEIFADHTKHPLASTRTRIVEQDDLFTESNGTIHAVYKENTYTDNRFFTDHIHWVKSPDTNTWQQQKLKLPVEINWVKLFEIDGIVYFFANSWNKSYVARLDTQELVKLPIPEAIGTYPYIARSPQEQSAQYIDILLLAADSDSFTKGTNTNYYIRIPKSELTKLPQQP